ncbi:MAG TPA: LLM class flavin-dependent oxidoreductase [Alphaproteobacteria bacterium]|nr:LLM class flavin-dependent oxidoreductase [Alphaproteobacteria bacterium]
MPIRITGMIGVTPPADENTVHIITGGISKEYTRDFARAHDEAGFDWALVGYSSRSAEGVTVAGYCAAHTERLGYLIAHRPGFVAPTLAARKFATFDNFWDGRLGLHIITGASDAEMAQDGDFSDKATRYRRSGEYVAVMRKEWAGVPFDFDGEFYKVRDSASDVVPYQKPTPPVLFGGSSEEALEMGAEHCDIFAIFGEPRVLVAERIADFRARCAKYERPFGKEPGFNISLRPIIAETEGAAWDKARRILAGVRAQLGGRNLPSASASADRMLAVAAEGEVHDERLWMAIAEAMGARGNTSCLVGTPEQVAESCLEYYKIGVEGILLRGFDPLNDALQFGRELIPRIREGAAAIDAERGQARAAE